MTRTLPRLLLVIAITVVANTPTRAAATHKVFHAAASGKPIVIAILADHYTDEAKFENDVQNFMTYGLLAHPYYATHASELQIETFYEPVAAGTASNYGFNVEIPSSNCVLSWQVGATTANDTWLKLLAVVGGINPRHTIVIGDHPYNIGCTEGEWTYVAEDAAGTDVLAHELGHGIGHLHDEWVLAPYEAVAHPGMSADPEVARNCHSTAGGAPPPWTFPGSGSHAGCDLYGLGVVHAYDAMTAYGGHSYCLMGGTSNAEFCPVCNHYMDQEFGYIENPDVENPDIDHRDLENPDTQNPGTRAAPTPPTGFRIIRAAFIQPPAPGTVKPGTPIVPVPPPIAALKPVPPQEPIPIVRLVVSFNPANGTLVAKKGFPITARYTPSYRRLGEYAYEVLDGDRTIGVGVLPSNLFRAHGYQGGAGHTTSPPHVTDVTIQMPDVTSEMLKDTNRNISVRIWWLSPVVTEKLITPAVLATLKARKPPQVERRGTVTAAQLREVM